VQLQGGPQENVLRTLQLFAYGTYADYQGVQLLSLYVVRACGLPITHTKGIVVAMCSLLFG
jgi:hypothetical protein